MQFFPSQAQFDQGRRAEGGDEYIGLRQLLVQRGLAAFRFQVGLQHLQALVHHLVGGGLVDAHGVCGAHALRRERFELGALGAHGLQPHHSGWAWQVQCEGENAHPFEGVGCCADVSICHSIIIYVAYGAH